MAKFAVDGEVDVTPTRLKLKQRANGSVAIYAMKGGDEQQVAIFTTEGRLIVTCMDRVAASRLGFETHQSGEIVTG